MHLLKEFASIGRHDTKFCPFAVVGRRGPVAGVGAGRFAGLVPATGTAGTTETTGIVPGRCFAPGIGSRASGLVRKPGLPFLGGLGGPGGPGPPAGKCNPLRAVRPFPAALLRRPMTAKCNFFRFSSFTPLRGRGGFDTLSLRSPHGAGVASARTQAIFDNREHGNRR